MGQYYTIVNADKKEWFHAHDFDCGIKLMEFSYVVKEPNKLRGNCVTSVLHKLMENEWKGDRVYIIGDYASLPEKDENGNYITERWDKEAQDYVPVVIEPSELEAWEPVLEALTKEAELTDDSYYHFAENTYKHLYEKAYKDEAFMKEFAYSEDNATISRYLCNSALKKYIDLASLPVQWIWLDPDEAPEWVPRNSYGNIDDNIAELFNNKLDLENIPEWVPKNEDGGIDDEIIDLFSGKLLHYVSVDPLTLLLAMGNDRGSGDYHSSYPGYEYVGTWTPVSEYIFFVDEAPEGYEKFNPGFTEAYTI